MLEKAHTGAANSDLPHSVVQNVFRGFLQRCLEKESDLASCAENRGVRKEGLDLPLVFFFFFFFFQTGTASENGLVAKASSEDCIL